MFLRGCREKRTFMHCWLNYKLVQQLWKTAWSFLKKLNIELPYDLAIPLPGTFPKKIRIPIQKDIYTCMFITALFTVAKIWKQPINKCLSRDEWIKKMWSIHTHTDTCTHTHTHAHTQWILISHKKEENLSICVNHEGTLQVLC